MGCVHSRRDWGPCIGGFNGANMSSAAQNRTTDAEMPTLGFLQRLNWRMGRTELLVQSGGLSHQHACLFCSHEPLSRELLYLPCTRGKLSAGRLAVVAPVNLSLFNTHSNTHTPPSLTVGGQNPTLTEGNEFRLNTAYKKPCPTEL